MDQRSKDIATRYVAAALVGATLGVVMTLAGSWREQLESGHSTLMEWPMLMRIGLPAIGGALGGVVIAATRAVRKTGRSGHYGAWMLAGTVAFVALVLPDALAERSFVGLAIGVGLGVGFGVGAGFGLGLVVRQVAGHRW